MSFINTSVKDTTIEDNFTSTGLKFWKHEDAMNAYKNKTGMSIICTHVSPESACNLNCPYCSVNKRSQKHRLPMDVIQDYINKLITRGLRAVIITGGGEPTLYPQINELICWIKYTQGLSVALITNGTLMDRLSTESLRALSWVRVSVNTIADWENRIQIPICNLSEDCIVGCSYIYDYHQLKERSIDETRKLFKKIAKVSDRINGRYVRILPDCLLNEDDFKRAHLNISKILDDIDDIRFFHQNKWHSRPNADVCHQSYFRPYLSEIPWDDDTPGTVFPCDSVVLNENEQQFLIKYRVCKPEDILSFLDHKMSFPFNPKTECGKCVFTKTVDMLDDWYNDKITKPSNINDIKLKHEEFI